MNTILRHPAVAGQFYPRDAQSLRAEVASYLNSSAETISAVGCVVPHAGYVYSGHVAGAVYSRLKLPSRYILMCPNHTGHGTPLSIMSQGEWQTPLGNVSIDRDLAESLKERFNQLSEDENAHRTEHAAEVQLPFLQARVLQFRFVPIAVGTSHYETLQGLGEALAEALAAQAEPVLIIASSDMNHYENDKVTRIKDRMAIDRILAIDSRGLFDVVMTEDISMCGFGPAVAMLTAAKLLGAKSAELVKYATSGDISGDRKAVVGYAGIAIRAA
jgi:MEMO1 family protein